MKLPKVSKRRRPVDDTPVEPIQTSCPMEDCGHLVSDHNMFGCCYNGDPCACLISREYLDLTSELNEEGPEQ